MRRKVSLVENCIITGHSGNNWVYGANTGGTSTVWEASCTTPLPAGSSDVNPENPTAPQETQDPDRLLFLAVDSGGTKCDVVVADATGAVLSRDSHRRPGASGRSATVIRESIRCALAGLSGDCGRFDVFLTGVPQQCLRGRLVHLRATNPAARRKAFLAVRALAEGQVSRIEDISESAAALAMHGLDEGIVALSGTGAFVHVVLPAQGVDLHYDGYGPLLGDHGGAYQIGLAAFRAAAAARWSPRRATSLRDAVFNALGVSCVHEAIELSLQPLDRSLLASLAKIVEEEALKGDAVAQAILLSAADALTETLADSANLDGGDAFNREQLAENRDRIHYL